MGYGHEPGREGVAAIVPLSLLASCPTHTPVHLSLKHSAGYGDSLS